MELISVIVPVYKVEKYLDRCVQSIVDQTYRNLEIILVDDGSPDNCPAMCDAWAAKDSRIKVIHKANGGLSDARNAGMAVATGQYIAFIDSDDWVHPDYISALHNACMKHHVPLCACDVTAVFEGEKTPLFRTPSEAVVYSDTEAMEYLTQGKKIRAVAWNKLYHSELIKEEAFPLGRYHEDEFFTYHIVAKAEKIAYIDIPMYFYLQREDSIMTSISAKHLDALDAYMERMMFLQTAYPHLYCRDKFLLCSTCVNMYGGASAIPLKDRKAYKKRIRKCRRSVRFLPKELCQYSRKEIVCIIGSRICIGMLSRILRAKRNHSRG